MDKINYNNVFKKMMEEIPIDSKPSLLLHACCGPCSCFPLTKLCERFNVTIYYNNSNIYPSEEFHRRLGELQKLLSYLKRDRGYEVKLIVPEYRYEEYIKNLEPLKNVPEGGSRCFLCYRLRMEEAYQYAEEHGFEYFTTVMTISRFKNAQELNRIGAELSSKHPKTRYLFSDFKKDGGQEIGRKMRIAYDLYNQLYCGCEYSLQEAKSKAESKGQTWVPLKK